MDQYSFIETLKSVGEIVKTAETPMSEEEMLSYFSDMDLDDAQKKMVVEYLHKYPYESEQQEENVESEPVEEKEDVESNSRVFQMYLEELKQMPSYKEEQLKEMYQQLLEGDTSMIAKLSDGLLRLVLEIARKYEEPKLHVEDLVQEGNLALFLQLQALCGQKGEADVELSLKTAVEQAVMEYASEVTGARELENAMIGKINLVHQARKMLTEENDKIPTTEELAAYTQMSVDEIKEIDEFTKY